MKELEGEAMYKIFQCTLIYFILISTICASVAFTEQLTISNLVFPMGERAFADFVSMVEGTIDGEDCDKGSDRGRIENVLGANFNTYIVDHCQSDHEGIIFDLDFIDNYIVNEEGADIAIFELVHLDGFDVAIYDVNQEKFTSYQHVIPIAIEGNTGAALIDLSNFGFERKATVTKIRINTKHIDDGSDQAEIMAIGALHSRPIPELTSDFLGNGQIGLDDVIYALKTISGLNTQFQPQKPTGIFRGVNLCGAEFGEINLPGTYEKDYIYPDPTSLDYYKDKGILLIRIPFRWERLQRTLFGDLDPDELSRLNHLVTEINQREMQCILDPHNFARYNGHIIGSSEVPINAYKDFWVKVADHFKSESAIFAYGLMNEPYETNGLWPEISQSAVDGIRSVDTKHTILIPGEGWSSAFKWKENNSNLNIYDSTDNLMYEAHVYFDEDESGRYKKAYNECGAYPEIGIDRVQPFINWLNTNGKLGFIGEYGIPNNDERWLVVVDKFLTYLESNNISSVYWAGGPWWSDDPLSIEPTGTYYLIDKPQMKVVSPINETEESVILLSPYNSSQSDLSVTFKWYILNSKQDITYNSILYTDKGVNPFDGSYEDSFDAGNANELDIDFPAYRYDPASFEWGVKVTTSDGRTIKSSRWRLRTSE